MIYSFFDLSRTPCKNGFDFRLSYRSYFASLCDVTITSMVDCFKVHFSQDGPKIKPDSRWNTKTVIMLLTKSIGTSVVAVVEFQNVSGNIQEIFMTETVHKWRPIFLDVLGRFHQHLDSKTDFKKCYKMSGWMFIRIWKYIEFSLTHYEIPRLSLR